VSSDDSANRARSFAKFNEGWSRKKNLSYDLGCDLSALCALLELLSEPHRPLRKTAKRQLAIALGVSEHAMRAWQELYGIICTEERTPAARAKKKKH
jgi:hypothetical protein